MHFKVIQYLLASSVQHIFYLFRIYPSRFCCFSFLFYINLVCISMQLIILNHRPTTVVLILNSHSSSISEYELTRYNDVCLHTVNIYKHHIHFIRRTHIGRITNANRRENTGVGRCLVASIHCNACRCPFSGKRVGINTIIIHGGWI